MEKNCNRCNQTRPLTEYHKLSKAKDGVQAYCKECQSDIDKKARAFRRANGPSVIKNSKECNICHQIKPIGQFGVRRDASDGRISYCKPCWTQYVKKAQKKIK
jgi:hypothetical protein